MFSMFIKRHHKKTLVTNLYTIEDNKKQYYYTVYTNGEGKEVNSELRTQDGKFVTNPSIHDKIKNLVLSK
jgi:hypothetical protein